ncbi:MAG: penicillin-binding protein activator [Kofleriaceae bacterium]
MSAAGRSALIWVAALASACGAAPQRPWLEEELGQTHETPVATEGDPAGRVEEGVDAPVGADAAAAVRAVDAALRALASDGGAAAAGDLEQALRAAPPSALGALERLAAARARAPGGARLSLHLARLWAHAGAWPRASAHLARAEAALAADPAPAPELARALAELQGRARVPAAATARVAVLLPLSGRFASIGAELRRAIEAAAPRGWLFLDTAGVPDRAVDAVERAAAAGVAAILGPVGEREALAASRRAAQQGIPMALLAAGDGADPRLGVFRLVWSPQDEARAVARWAAANDFPTVAVLAPRDDVGELAAAAFVAEAQAVGLTVAARGQYDAVGGAVEQDVKAFLGLVPAQNPRLAAHLRRGGKRAWQTFVPDIPFSLLYVPDHADRAALVAAFLPYLNVELRTQDIMDPVQLRRKYRGVIPQVVQLVGGAGWNVPALAVRGGAAVQGAILFDVCAAQRDETSQTIFDELTARLGHTPTSAAAQAYDAARWLGAAIASLPAGAERGAVRAALARAAREDGACGPLSLGPDGEVVREPAALLIEGEDLVISP